VALLHQSWESIMIPSYWPPRFAGAARCGLSITVPGMTAVSCADPSDLTALAKTKIDVGYPEYRLGLAQAAVR